MATAPEQHVGGVRLPLQAILVVLVLLAAALAASLFLMRSDPAAAATGAATAPLTQARLAKLLRQGVRIRRVPADLVPSPAAARSDVSLAWKRGCLVSGTATTNQAGCVFGDPNSRTTVVLFGDSHAGAWFSGIQAVSNQQHWRLIFMGKVGCPYADVLVRGHRGNGYTSCVTWRHNSERQIAQLHPTMVVATSGDYVGSAQPVSGGYSNDRKKTWLNGVSATFRRLRRAAKHVVFIADVPRMKQTTFDCVAAHMSNVFPCTVPRSSAFLWPSVRRGEFKLAKAHGVIGIDPAPWFCTAVRCPVIANDILIFRDTQHITPQWSEFLAPLLRARLASVVNARRG